MTPRQAETLAFVKEYTARNGHSPNYDEIAAHLGIRSKSGVVRLVDALVAQRRLAKLPHRGRALVVVDTRHVCCPKCGHHFQAETRG